MKLLAIITFCISISTAFAGTVSPYTPGIVDSGQIWVNTDVVMKFYCQSDNISGCDPFGCVVSTAPQETTFSVNGGPVTLCHSDLAGNEVTQQTYVNWIDKIVPEIDQTSFECKDILNNPYDGSNWTNNDVICTFSTQDSGGSNIKSIKSKDFIDYEPIIAVDNIDESDYEATAVFSEDVKKTFNNPKFVLMDYATNENTPFNQSIGPLTMKIDKTLPEVNDVTCTSGGLAYSDLTFFEGWTNENVICEYLLEDPNPLINSKIESWKSNITSTGVGSDYSWFIEKQGQSLDNRTEEKIFGGNQIRIYSFEGYVKDNAKNVSSTNKQAFEIKIDKKLPTLIRQIQLSNEDHALSVDGIQKSLSDEFVADFRANEKFTLSVDAKDPSVNGVASGINWENSFIEIEGPVNLPRTKISTLSDNNVKFDSVLHTITFLDGSEIFEKVGVYTIDLEIKDKAGNSLDQSFNIDGVVTLNEITNLRVRIKPANADQTNSSLSSSTSNSLLANNDDLCEMELHLEDRFGNNVARDFLIYFPGQNIEGTYNLIENNTQAFLNGLRLKDGFFDSSLHKIELNTDASGDQSFFIRSISPSIQIVQGSVAESFLMKNAVHPTSINTLVPTVDAEGIVKPLITNTINKMVNLDFEPWVKGFLSDNPNNASPSDPSNFSFGSKLKIYSFLATQSTDLLPTNNLKVFVKGHSPQKTEFRNENLTDDDGSEILYSSTSFSEERDISTYLNSTGGIITEDINVAFTSKIQFKVADNNTTRTLTHPGGNLGNKSGNNIIFPDITDTIGGDDTPVSGIIVGADIEGQILTKGKNFTYQKQSASSGEAQILKIGNVSALDVREDITFRANELIRGLEQETNPDLRGGIDFTNQDVLYFSEKETIELSGEIKGVGTIIIENGNLFITGDLNYNDKIKDSLGIILINSTTQKEPTTGNIYVLDTVQKMVGTFFADGTFTSADINVDRSPKPSIDREDSLLYGKQLLLKGTLFTRNTLGGALLDIGNGNYLGPWGDIASAERPTAQKYDLHFIRRYEPSGDTDSAQFGVAPEYNPNCVKSSGLICDPNKHAFVIRPDGKVKNMPPPGFSKALNIAR